MYELFLCHSLVNCCNNLDGMAPPPPRISFAMFTDTSFGVFVEYTVPIIMVSSCSMTITQGLFKNFPNID